MEVKLKIKQEAEEAGGREKTACVDATEMKKEEKKRRKERYLTKNFFTRFALY
jgi:hypothetical protein